jgi:hypothetical protein
VSSQIQIKKTKLTSKRPLSSTSTSSLNVKLIEQSKVYDVASLKLENSELSTLNKANEIERQRLIELMKALQKRIDELNEKCVKGEKKLNDQSRKCIVLERQLEKYKLQEKENTRHTGMRRLA